MYYGSTLFSCLSSISTRPSSTNFWAKSNFQPTMEQLLRQNSIAIFVPYNSSNVYGQYRLASINRIDQRTVEQPSSTEFFAASSLFYILHKSLPCYANIQPLVFFFLYFSTFQCSLLFHSQYFACILYAFRSASTFAVFVNTNICDWMIVKSILPKIHTNHCINQWKWTACALKCSANWCTTIPSQRPKNTSESKCQAFLFITVIIGALQSKRASQCQCQCRILTN